jgi:hypothetical protein
MKQVLVPELNISIVYQGHLQLHRQHYGREFRQLKSIRKHFLNLSLFSLFYDWWSNRYFLSLKNMLKVTYCGRPASVLNNSCMKLMELERNDILGWSFKKCSNDCWKNEMSEIKNEIRFKLRLLLNCFIDFDETLQKWS